MSTGSDRIAAPPDAFIVGGSVAGADGGAVDAAAYTVFAFNQRRQLARSDVGPSGEFALSWQAGDGTTIATEVRAMGPEGTLASCVRPGMPAHYGNERIEVVLDAPDETEPSGRVNTERAEPPVPLSDFERVYGEAWRALRRGSLRGRHGVIDGTGWIHRLVADLEQFDQCARRLLAGDGREAPHMREMLDSAPAWPAVRTEAPQSPSGRSDTSVGPTSPEDVVAAGAVLDALLCANHPGCEWAERAAGFYLSRVSLLRRAVRAAEDAASGQSASADFAARLLELNPYAQRGHDHAATEAQVGHDHDHTHEHEHDGAHHDDGRPQRHSSFEATALEHPESWDEQTRELAARLARLAARGWSELEVPLVVGNVTPAVTASDERVRITLRPATGWEFPAREQARELVASLDETALAVDVKSWSGDAIELELSTGSRSGCVAIGAHGSRPAARVWAFDAPSIRLTANTVPGTLEVPAGADVRIAWDVGGARCDNGVTADGPTLAHKIRLTKDGDVLYEGEALRGAVDDFVERNASYTLDVTAFAGERRLGGAQADVEVRTYRQATVRLLSTTVKAGDPALVEVRIDKPHERRLDLDIARDGANVEPGAAIEPGTLSTVVAVPTDVGRAGRTEVTVDVPGYDPASVSVLTHRRRCDPQRPEIGGRWDIAVTRISGRTPTTNPVCVAEETLSRARSTVYGAGGAVGSAAGARFVDVPRCFNNTSADIAACDSTRDASLARCNAEHASRVAACNFQCTAFADCPGACNIQCTAFTNCDTFWVTDPRRYACYVARGACVVAAAAARGVCLAGCYAARAACVAAAAVATAACIAASAVVLAACVAAAWTVNTACRAGVVVRDAACAVGNVIAGIVLAVVALALFVVGLALGIAGIPLAAGCRLTGAGTTRLPPAPGRLRIVAIHMAMLHTGKVLIFNYDEGNFPVTSTNLADPTIVGDSSRGLCVLWDPQTEIVEDIPIPRNLFCAGHSFARNGELFVASGQFAVPLVDAADDELHRFDPVTQRWTRLPDMQEGRWYPTVATLPDGRALVISGTNGFATASGFGRGIRDSLQIVDPLAGTVGPNIPLGFNIFHTYPFMFVLPSGRVFLHYKKTTQLVTVRGGSVSFTRTGWDGVNSGPRGTGVTRSPFSRTGPGPGTSVLLPLEPRLDAQRNAVRYAAGRVLILGGGGAEPAPEPEIPEEAPTYTLTSETPADDTAEILDLDAPHPQQWRWTGLGRQTRMHRRRVMPDAVLLPDGKVFITNGGERGKSGGFLAHLPTAHGGPPMGADLPALEPEVFDPVSEEFEPLCPKTVGRLYHATALLLSDGRVLVGGHDGLLNMPPNDQSRYELELYSPPYLFRGARPRITSAPSRVAWGSRFTVETPDAASIRSVALIRQGSITHQINTDQRFVGLHIRARRPGAIDLDAPPHGGVAPPAFYMLFLVNTNGVPSIARFVRVDV